jgi:hypothetical protein
VRRRLATGAVAAVAVIVLGCGSQPLTDSQLHSVATRLCSTATAQTDRIATPASPAETEAFLQRGIAAFTPALSGLRQLRPPSEVADVYSASVKAFGQKLSYLKDAEAALRKGEDPVIALKTLQHELTPLESQENGGWEALQLPACLSR